MSRELPGGWLPPSDREYRPPPPDDERDRAGAPDSGDRPAPAGADRGWLPPTDSAPAGASPWPGQPAAPPPGGYVVPTANGKANVSLVLGIIGLVACPLVFSVLALVLGYRARREIDASQGRQHNRGTATAGIVCGWIGLVVGIVLIVVFLVSDDLLTLEDDGGGGGSDDTVRAPLSPALAAAARSLAPIAGL